MWFRSTELIAPFFFQTDGHQEVRRRLHATNVSVALRKRCATVTTAKALPAADVIKLCRNPAYRSRGSADALAYSI